MSPFITYRDIEEGELQYYILQREFPHYVGIISTYPKTNFIESMPVTGYNLWIIFDGTIKGSVIPSYKNVYVDITSALNEMSNWYYANRIVPQEKKYKKFKK